MSLPLGIDETWNDFADGIDRACMRKDNGAYPNFYSSLIKVSLTQAVHVWLKERKHVNYYRLCSYKNLSPYFGTWNLQLQGSMAFGQISCNFDE